MLAAAYNRNQAVVTSLLKAGADVRVRDKGGETAMIMAAAHSQEPAVLTALSKARADVNARDKGGLTPLMVAAQFNPNAKFIPALVRIGADIKAQNNGVTALMLAAGYNHDSEVVAALLKAGANVNTKDKDGNTALMYACSIGQDSQMAWEAEKAKQEKEASAAFSASLDEFDTFEVGSDGAISALLKAGANVNVRNKDGVTALIYAAISKRNSGVIVTLLKAGADATVKDNSGSTALDYAQDNENFKGTNAYRELFFELVKTGKPQDIQAAIRKGADAAAPDSKGDTALMYAAEFNQDPAVINTLLKAGAKVNARSGNGVTPLMYAAGRIENYIDMLVERSGGDITSLFSAPPKKKAAKKTPGSPTTGPSWNPNPDVFTALLKAGADVNAKDKDGNTALICAAISENADVLAVLLKSGADPKIKDNTGKTAFDYAQKNKKLVGTEPYQQLQKSSK